MKTTYFEMEGAQRWKGVHYEVADGLRRQMPLFNSTCVFTYFTVHKNNDNNRENKKFFVAVEI